jgi:predicted DNA-binding transcriptional regulator YafY
VYGITAVVQHRGTRQTRVRLTLPPQMTQRATLIAHRAAIAALASLEAAGDRHSVRHSKTALANTALPRPTPKHRRGAWSAEVAMVGNAMPQKSDNRAAKSSSLRTYALQPLSCTECVDRYRRM